LPRATSKFYSQVVIYIAFLAALLVVFSIIRIVRLNAEITTLDTAGTKTQELVTSWEAKNPLDATSPETFAASKSKMPQDIQEAETEYLWLWNERDSKKESRTLWFGGAILALVVGVIALLVHF
jgi:hypothetical protein